MRNSDVIKTFETLEGRPLVKVIGSKNKKQTFLSLILALRVINDYNPVLSYHIFKLYEQDLLVNSQKNVIELENTRIDLDLGGVLVYWYSCNNKGIFGSSFCNKNGQRLKSHKTFVQNISIGFVIYSSKETLQELNKVINKKFKIKNRREHLKCELPELKDFVFKYLELMDFDYKEEDRHVLTMLNIYLS